MSEISREDLRQHCLRMVKNAKKMAEQFGFELENHTGYQEHKMVLELIEKAEKLEKIKEVIFRISDIKTEEQAKASMVVKFMEIEQIINE